MYTTRLIRAGLTAAAVLIVTASLRAQSFEDVGSRAQGMAGAFVAVADDSTATWWNPAGLATGAYFGATLERGWKQQPSEIPVAGPAQRTKVSGFSVGFPSLGLSYYRLRISEIAPTSAIASGAEGRQDQQATSVPIRTLGLTQFGASVGQSLTDHLVVATTVSLVRGGRSAGIDVASGEDSLDRAADLDISNETQADFDVGVMAPFRNARIGLTVKHVTQPDFGKNDARIELTRQARAGVAVFGRSPGIVRSLTAALDVDLTKRSTVLGDIRRLAVGAEAWIFASRVGLRGGVSRNTIGDAGTSGSGGVSISVRSGMFLDGAFTNGSDRSLNGWSVSLRMTRF